MQDPNNYWTITINGIRQMLETVEPDYNMAIVILFQDLAHEPFNSDNKEDVLRLINDMQRKLESKLLVLGLLEIEEEMIGKLKFLNRGIDLLKREYENKTATD